jgi:hypothetical protein
MADSVLKVKNYLIISVLSSLGIFIISLGLHSQIDLALTQLRSGAVMAGMSYNIANVVTEPLRAAFTNGLPGAIVAGFLWPVSALWLILIFLLFFYATLGSGFGQAATTISS